MSTQGREYQRVRKLLMPQMIRCRDQEVRIKVELILYALKIENVRLACMRLGFGKSFFYKWWGRLQANNFKISSLKEKSRRPKHSPQRIPINIEQDSLL